MARKQSLRTSKQPYELLDDRKHSMVLMVVLICFISHLNQLLHTHFYFQKQGSTMNEELESISIFNSYVKSIDQLARWDMQLAQELSYWIIQFGIKWIEPPADANPFMLSAFEQIKVPLMKWRNKWKNAKKKSDENENEIKSKSNQNQNEIKSKSNDDKKKNKKENKNNNLNTLSSNEDNGASTEYGNSEINECIEIIKSFNWWMIDWTQRRNRIYWKNLIGKLKHSPPVQKWFTWQQTLQAILQIVSNNKFHRSKITNPKSIYDNLTLLLQLCEQEWIQNQVIQTL